MSSTSIRLNYKPILYGWCNWDKSARKCVRCKQVYTPNAPTQKYCSLECRVEAATILKKEPTNAR